MSKVLAIIPVRGGSKGVPRKNVRVVGGRPLMAHGVVAARDSGVVDKVVVATEDREMMEVGRSLGAQVVELPESLTTDSSRIEPVMLFVLEQLEGSGYAPDLIGLIQATSPFISSEIVRRVVNIALSERADSCFTAYVPHGHDFAWRRDSDSGLCVPVDYQPSKRPLRQEMEVLYHENGACYFTSRGLFIEHGTRFGGDGARTAMVEMTEGDSMQIDDESDLWLAEQMFRRKEAL